MKTKIIPIFVVASFNSKWQYKAFSQIYYFMVMQERFLTRQYNFQTKFILLSFFPYLSSCWLNFYGVRIITPEENCLPGRVKVRLWCELGLGLCGNFLGGGGEGGNCPRTKFYKIFKI